MKPLRTFITLNDNSSKLCQKMARGAQSKELKAAFEKHREETEGQAERQIFDLLGKKVQGKTCGAIEGIIIVKTMTAVLHDFDSHC
jgi:ferritin-like metal-binding protein YciE